MRRRRGRDTYIGHSAVTAYRSFLLGRRQFLDRSSDPRRGARTERWRPERGRLCLGSELYSGRRCLRLVLVRHRRAGAYGQTWTTANAGKTWAFHRLPTVGGYDVWYTNAVSCWGPTSCAMAATGTTTKPRSLYYALFLPISPATGAVAGAQTTSSNGLRPQYMDGLNCYAPGQCVAVGQNWLSPASAAIETSSGGKWVTTFTQP